MASRSDHETSDANGEAMFPQASAHSHQYDRVSDSRGIRRAYHENAVTRKDGFPEDARNTDSSPRVTGSTGARRKTFVRNQQRDDQKKQIGTRRYHEHQHIGNSRNNGTRGGEFPRADNYRYNGETKRRSGLDRKVAGSGVREANRSSNAKGSTNSVKQTREGKKPTRNQSERIRSAPKGRERDEGRQGEMGSTQTAFRQRGKDIKASFEENGDHGKENGKTHARVSCATSADNIDESQRRQGQGNQQASEQNPHQVKSRIKTTPFSEQELQSFLEEEPSDVLSKLVKKKDECMALLNQDKLSESTLILTLRVFSSLCELDPVSAYTKQLNIVLTMIECSLFLSKHLTRYLVSLPLKQPQKVDGCDANDDQSHGASDVSMILRLLQLFLQHKQSGYSEVGGALILLERVVTKDCLMGELQQLKIGYNSVEQSQKSAKQRAMEKPPPNNFRDIPIFPESAEIRQVTKPFLRKNIIQGRYENVEHYLDVQFRLLREDFVAPLREGISEFLSDTTGRPQDIRVYNYVSIVKRTMGENGFVHTLQFDTRPLKRVRWESSKRLIYGSFVCLTRDNFKHIVGATVENRNPKDLEKGLFDVRFLTETPSTMGPFIMAESAAYFEACRHVLQGLQQVDESNFPFKKYIVDVASGVDPPEYLRDDDSVTYDLKSLVGSDCHRRVVPILTLESWPSADDLHLDESQKAALQTALTKEFAIIQGPPGTGKTYIGLKIIEVLLHNRPRILLHNRPRNRLGDLLENASPVLVVCYTNHALDQFLEGIIAFGEENIHVVRVGGRSNSEALKYKNLSCLRRDRRGSHRERGNTGRLRGLLRESDDSIRRILLKLDLPTKVLLNVEALGRYMTRGEYGALSLRWPEGEKPQRDPSEKLLNWLQVFDMTNEEYSGHPSRQHEEKPQVRKYTEFVNVEDRSQLDRQIDDSYDDRSTFQECRQTMEAQIFRENAAYSLRGIKRCGKYQTVPPVVELQKPDVMTDEEASSIERVWYLMIWDRWRLYRLWVKRYIQDHEEKLQNERQRYEAISRDVQDMNVEEDLEILRGANVIGMTTTGAAKHRTVLQRLGPRIVVVEEAAEVLEAHIITTLTANCQHLILIGDHQQLKPNPTVYRLARWFNLDTSLFERMINNGVPCQSLTHQHRMRPEISTVMKNHFYQGLQDDKSVWNMDDVRGVAHNMFFIDHQHFEDEDDDNRTRSNQYEAEVLVELCRYLLRQGYESSQITILATYTGQLFCFRRLMDRATFEGVRVCVVDNYQGEENDIILLSLVRSNEDGSIGFLRTTNRVCVALSRARMGFYCIGNASILKKAQIWQDIFGTLEAENRIGSSLPLVCQNHPTKLTQVAMAEDFRKKVPCGGCDQSCEYRLPCGHVCASFCHPDDPDHEEYECDKPCLHSCDRGDHLCPLQCVEECEPCKVKVTKSMSDCGHVIQVSCHEFEEVTCTEPCPKSFDNCGHQCKMECGQSCLATCPEKCERRLGCSHNCYEPCGKSCTVHCKVQVQRTLLKCGHTVSMDCGEHPYEHNCKTMVTKRLTKCGHQAKMFCYMPEHSDSISCKERCEKILPCGHQCPNVCGKPCKDSDVLQLMIRNRIPLFETYYKERSNVKACKELVDKTYPSCNHRVKLHCNQTVSSVPCSSQCEKLLVCGHRCPNKCSKLCPRKKEDDKVIYEVSVTQKIYDNYYFSEMCREKCERMLPCGHQCPNACGEPCPQEIPDTKRRYLGNITTNCQKPVRKKLPNCGHAVTVPCFEDVCSFTCLKKCEKVLPCGHPCPNKCSEPCPEDVVFKKSDRSTGRTKERQRPSPRDRCEVLIKKDLPCDHGTKLMPCWKAESAITCREPCRDRLGCGHKCHGDCQSCNGGMQHKSCTAKCNRQLLCGHRCSEVCSISCPSDCRRCRGGTTHGTSQDSTEIQPCKHNIKHHQLKTNSCIRPCNRNLPCKHPCIGVCGEPCPPFCNVCKKNIVRANLPKGRTQARDLFIYLPDCKHLCEMRYLDRMVAATKSSLERYFKIHSLLCPKCNEPIGHCPRYDDILKIVRESINEARRKCLVNKRDRFRGNRVDIPPASAGATANVSFEVGRWMRCPQGHVFCQDKNDEQPDKHKPCCPECPQ